MGNIPSLVSGVASMILQWFSNMLQGNVNVASIVARYVDAYAMEREEVSNYNKVRFQMDEERGLT